MWLHYKSIVCTLPRLLVTIGILMVTDIVVGQTVDATKDKSKLTYRVSQTWIDSSYRSNASSLKAIEEILKNDRTIRSVRITATSSPEGPASKNAELARMRAETLEKLILSSLSYKQRTPEISISFTPENWDGLTKTVRNVYYLTDRVKIMDILEDDSISDSTRKWRLRQIDGGHTWDFMKRHYMTGLRLACIEGITYSQDDTIASPEYTLSGQMPAKILHETGLKYPARTNMDGSDQEAGECRRGFTAALRTNLLYDAALIPNIGLEFHLGKGWSLGAGWNCAWWDNDSRHHFWRLYGGELELRKYFGPAARRRPMSGHHLSLYAQAGTYDFEVGAQGQLSELSYGAGLAYGYSVPIARSLNLDLAVGMGYIGGDYKIYEPQDGCYVWLETRGRRYLGPTKAEVSLVWLIGNKGRYIRKGGAR